MRKFFQEKLLYSIYIRLTFVSRNRYTMYTISPSTIDIN